jgi:hypothetical protein
MWQFGYGRFSDKRIGRSASGLIRRGSQDISLDQALPIALKDARERFPDLREYLLYSASPRVLKGDKKGLFWQFLWQEKAFPHYKGLTVRVYMTDSSTFAERWEKGTYQKENDRPLNHNSSLDPFTCKQPQRLTMRCSEPRPAPMRSFGAIGSFSLRPGAHSGVVADLESR